jgi:hypothetical protein
MYSPARRILLSDERIGYGAHVSPPVIVAFVFGTGFR